MSAQPAEKELSFRTCKLMIDAPYPTSDLRCPSFSLDVSSRDSIIEAKNLIEEKEGKLHILVNKYGLLTKLV